MLLAKILFRNAFHNKLRSSLTILGIAVAILAFGLLRTVISSFYAGVEASSASRLVTRNAISIIFALPISYAGKIQQVEGVKTVSWGNWFGGIYIDEKNFFPNFCIDPVTYFSLYPEFMLDEKQKRDFLLDRKGGGRPKAGRQIQMENRRHDHAQRHDLSGQLGFCAERHLPGPR